MRALDFTDKVAVITGAGSGIGQALAVQLAAAGAHLALADIRSEASSRRRSAAAERWSRVAAGCDWMA